MTVALASTSPGHHTSIRTADGDVERAWERLRDAEDAFCSAPLGSTDELFRLRDSWVRAIGGYERARLRHAVAVKQANGLVWLREVAT